jgi:hypothetical protein
MKVSLSILMRNRASIVDCNVDKEADQERVRESIKAMRCRASRKSRRRHRVMSREAERRYSPYNGRYWHIG